MPKFCIFQLNPTGQISDLPEIVECTDDHEAIAKAQHAVGDLDVELWEGKRLVVRLPRLVLLNLGDIPQL